MRRFRYLLLWVFVCSLADAQGVSRQYDPFTSYNVFASYANTSSHIMIGRSEDQRLLLLGGNWNVREGSGRWASWHYQAELIPVALLVSPYSSRTQTITYYPGVTLPPNFPPPGTLYSEAISSGKCFPASGTNVLVDVTSGSAQPIGTNVYSFDCSHITTYGAGLSPLGEKVNFLPRHRVQPYLTSNAGFLAFTRNVPSNGATRFNFTFELGGGVEVYTRKRRSWALDVRYHHTSDAYRGTDDPGIDSVLVRVSYGFSRSTR